MSAPFAQSPQLSAVPSLRHGFFGRQGGVSSAPYASNNMSTSLDDAPERVEANRTGAAAALGFKRASLCLLKQVHSADVLVVTDRPDGGAIIAADAMVTALPGVALAILTADCTPILFADAEAGIIGAAHAGWRGAVDGIVGNTIAAMIALGARPDHIIAAVGPTISGPNYEVGDAFKADFLALHPDGEAFFHTPPGRKVHFDLPAFAASQLSTSGIEQVDFVGGCTYGQPDLYFSHRFATHQQSGTGRQISIIGLT